MPDPRPEPDPEIGDASLLFGDEAGPSASASGASPSTPVAPDGGYAIDGPEPEAEATPAPPIPPIDRPRVRPSSKPAPASKRAKRSPSSGVDPLWSRGAEWGSNLAALGLGVAFVGWLLSATFSLDFLGPWVLLSLASLVALAVLAYPIFITLERPVRVTPEQALKDYFGALSHRVPHYKRMWLLLATDAKTSPAFATFPEFKAYWKSRLAAWKLDAEAAGALNPFVVEVADFKSDKSAGQTEVDAEYMARVILPRKPADPVATYRVSLRLVRGSDKMWYLESGTLGAG